MKNFEELKNLLDNQESIWREKNDCMRICIFGNQETQFNNNKILKALGSSTKRLQRMLKDNNIECIDLMHDDGILHLTISNADGKRLGLETDD